MDVLILIACIGGTLLLFCKLLDYQIEKASANLRMTQLEHELEKLPDSHPDKLHSHLTSDNERRQWALKIKTKRMNEVLQ